MVSHTTTGGASALLAALLAVVPAAPARAQDGDIIAERVSGIVQLDVTNAYFFRGILEEKRGVQIQPWAELYVNLFSSETGFLHDVTIGGGTWNSFQSERTLATEGPQWFYASDYYPLLSLGFAGGITLLTTYYWYSSPNGAFNTVEELNLKLSWDDSEVNKTFSLKPWVNLAIETHDSALEQGTPVGREGQGVQLGIAPTLYSTKDESFTLTGTGELGFAINNYYEEPDGEENHFGYGNVGLLASFPLGFVPESAGAWTFSLSGKYYFFSNTLERLNSGRSTYPVGTASLSVEF